VVVTAVSPQRGGVGLLAFLHVFRSAFFSARQVFLQSLPALSLEQPLLQVLKSLVIAVLQSALRQHGRAHKTRPEQGRGHC